MEANLDYAPTVGLEASEKCLKIPTGSEMMSMFET